MSRPQKVLIDEIRTRKTRVSKAVRHRVRWTVDGRAWERTFPTKAQANEFRSRLAVSRSDGERFSAGTGEPESWGGSDSPFSDIAAKWLAAEWSTWAPKSRRSALEVAVEATTLAVSARATDIPSSTYDYLKLRLDPDHGVRVARREVADWRKVEEWLRRYGLAIRDLDSDAAIRLRGNLAYKRVKNSGAREMRKPNTLTRYRNTTHQLIKFAIDSGDLPSDPWPAPKKGRKRVAERVDHSIKTDELISPEEALAVIAHIPSSQPGSVVYQVLTEVLLYAGLRPSEALALRREDVDLPEDGWGLLRVRRALVNRVESATKTGETRDVPIPPALVMRLRAHCGDSTGPMFLTSNGTPADPDNWRRALRRATKATGVASVSPYSFRHLHATQIVNAGVAVPEAARRLGHTVQTFMLHYWKVISGDAVSANQRIESLIDSWQGTTSGG